MKGGISSHQQDLEGFWDFMIQTMSAKKMGCVDSKNEEDLLTLFSIISAKLKSTETLSTYDKNFAWFEFFYYSGKVCCGKNHKNKCWSYNGLRLSFFPLINTFKYEFFLAVVEKIHKIKERMLWAMLINLFRPIRFWVTYL